MTIESRLDPFYGKMVNQATVESLMTPRDRFVLCGPDELARQVLARMEKNDFDQMPVGNGHDVREYVLRKDLVSDEEEVLAFAKKIGPSDLLSADTLVTTALPLVLKNRFYFILKDASIVGLVTFADFDKRPVRVLLYLLFSELESDLLKLLRRHKNSEYWIGKLPESRQKVVRKWQKKRRKEGLGLDELDCFSLIDFFIAVRSEGSLLSSVGDSLDDYNTLNELRDKISHSGLDIAASRDQLDDLIGAKKRLLGILENLRTALGEQERLI